MAELSNIQGIDTVVKNINKELNKMKIRSVSAYRRVVILLWKDMNTTPPVIPVDTGNLRGSWFNEFVQDLKSGNTAVIFGFSANYSVYVHERVEGAPWGAGTVGKVDWNRKGSGPKFLEAAIKRNVDNILQIMRNEMMIR